MRIGFFADGFPPQPNGVATSVVSSARELEARGHEVYVVAPKHPGYKDDMNVFRLTSIKVMNKPEFRLALHLPEKPLRKLLKLDFDIIHAHSGGPITLLGLEIAKAKNIPLIATYHTLWNKYTHYFLKGKVIKPKMIEQATKIFGNRCDSLIAPSHRVEKELQSYGIKKPIVVIPSGVDLKKFANPKKGIFRKKLGIAKDEKVLLYVGRLGKEKSVDFLVQAFKIILASHPDTSLVLVGDGPQKKELRSLAKELGVGKKVFFPGFIESYETPEAYGDADIFVFASRTETQGMVILEAMASGLPVVAVEDEAFSNVVRNGENGFLTESDTQKFAQVVVELLSSSEQRSKFSLQSKEMVISHSTQVSVDMLEALYTRVLEDHSRQSIRKIMDADRAREELFLILLIFWATILSVRFYIFAFIKGSAFPVLSFFGYSIPHLFIGALLVGLAFLLRFSKKTNTLISLFLFGAGSALLVDQGWGIITRGADTYSDYWSRGNLALILLFALIPVVFARYIKRNKPQFFFGHGKNIHKNPDNPYVSVVIPAFNEEKFLERTLISLVNQTYKNFELIVVDNNSTDGTSEVAKKYGALVLLETKKGVAFARQKGGMCAKGEIIASTDADTIVPEDWLEKILIAFQDEKVAAFGGLNRLYSGPVTARTSARYLSTLFWVVDKHFSNGWNLLGSNMAVRKKSFIEIGGFNTALTLGEDVDLSQRIKTVGKVVLDTNFLVFSSGRRFKNGLLLGVVTYAPSWFMRVVFKKDKFLTFPTIRNEDSLISKFSLIPLVFFITVIVAIFYSANPVLTKAREIRFVEKMLELIQNTVFK